MRRVGALLILACAVAAAGAGAAFLVAGTARAGPEDCADGGCPTTTTVTTTTAPPTTTAPVTTTTTEPPPTVTTAPPPTTTVTPTEPDTPPRHHKRPRPTRPAKPEPAPVKTPPRRATLPITRVTPPLRGGPYVFPVYGPVSFSDTFGAPRADTGWHQGGDIFAPLGAPVLAVADGTLFVVGWNRVGGYRLWLRDRGGNFFYYAHLSAFSSLSVAGARVRAGTVVGFVGNTGDAGGTPYHLHFEIHPASLISQGYAASAVNPTSYLRSWKRAQSFRLGAGDSRLARSTGWAAALALPSATPAPAPAVLLQANDISRAAGLAPKQVKQAFAPPAHRTQLRPLWRPRTQRPVVVFDPRARTQARKARSLDRGAQLPLGLPTVWDTLAQCEAGGNWSTNTGNGFYGGLQFTPGTWLAHGGAEFAPSAEQATREQQILVAERVLADQGWVAWPACSLKLGLR